MLLFIEENINFEFTFVVFRIFIARTRGSFYRDEENCVMVVLYNNNNNEYPRHFSEVKYYIISVNDAKSHQFGNDNQLST